MGGLRFSCGVGLPSRWRSQPMKSGRRAQPFSLSTRRSENPLSIHALQQQVQSKSLKGPHILWGSGGSFCFIPAPEAHVRRTEVYLTSLGYPAPSPKHRKREKRWNLPMPNSPPELVWMHPVNLMYPALKVLRMPPSSSMPCMEPLSPLSNRRIPLGRPRLVKVIGIPAITSLVITVPGAGL